MKDTKKLKELKASIGNDAHLNIDSNELSLPPLACYGDHTEADNVSEAVEALKEQEKTCRHQIELEEEDRKLGKSLEYQRRIEDVAKERHTAEQQLIYNSIVHRNVAKPVNDVCTDNVVGDINLQKLDNSSNQENRIQRNRVLDDLEGTKVNTNGVLPSRNQCAISDTAMVQDVKSQKVVPNGIVTEAGVFQPDQRTGRRGRRQKASNKFVPEKSQVTLSESGNCQSQRSGTDGERQSEPLRSNGGQSFYFMFDLMCFRD